MRGLSLLLALFLAFAPAFAEARPGGGYSLGSRGSRTWSAPTATPSAPSGASPFQRSLTPQAPSNYGSYGGYGRSYGGYGGYNRGSAFTSGLLGGLLGAGIGGMLFGRGFFGGISGGFGFLGFLLQLVLLYFLARFLFRRFFAGGAPVFAGGVPFLRPNAGMQPGGGGGSSRSARPVAVGPADYQAFEQVLRGIQAAWSAGDLARLSQMATPEMVSYFSEQLSELASRGLRNEVSNVQLLQGDLSEAWAEGSREYATVSMRYALTDVTRDARGAVVDGSAAERVTVTEYWTFLRANGGRWLLSAIQQERRG